MRVGPGRGRRMRWPSSRSRLDVTDGAGERVPAWLFVPRADGPLPLVLLGHGAHLSKDDPIAQLLASAIARGVPAGVALID